MIVMSLTVEGGFLKNEIAHQTQNLVGNFFSSSFLNVANDCDQ